MKQSGVHSEAASTDINTINVFPKTLVNSKDGHCSIQVLMWTRLGTFLKKIPSRTSTAKEEMSKSGFILPKDWAD